MSKRTLILSIISVILLLIAGLSYYFKTSFSSSGIILPFTSPTPQYVPSASTLDQIFSSNRTWTATLSAGHLRTLVSTGDVIPARSVNFGATKKNNFRWPFEKTADILRSADVTVINLETPLIKNCPVTNEGMIFCGDGRNIEGLVYAGVDVASLVNNHIENQGIKGVEETVRLLESQNIISVISNPTYKDFRDLQFAFLGYNDLEPPGIEKEKIIREVGDARKNASVVVVSIHWGNEYTSMPSARQNELAHLAVDAGADLVLGNHPHWIQPVEIYKDKLIVYAHGNFIFDQMWSEKTKEGVVGRSLSTMISL